MRSRLLIGLLLAAGTLATYWKVTGHEFINCFDDSLYVVDNDHVRGGLTVSGIAWAFTTVHASNWHPLTWISHMLDCRLFGLNPTGHHLVNLLLHLANTLVLFLLLYRMTGFLYRSAFAAALFALHPLHVESVAWVSERKDVLSTLFWLLTIWAYVRYTELPTLRRYLPVVLLFALGLMSKPMLVTLPFVLLLLDYWPLDRWSLEITRSGKIMAGWHLVKEKVPLIALSAASSVITIAAQQKGGAVGSIEMFPLTVRAANALAAYTSYIGKMIWPRDLAVFYPHPGSTLPAWQIVGSAFLLISISILAVRVRRRYPHLAVGWFWYLLTLVPFIGIFAIIASLLPDRTISQAESGSGSSFTASRYPGATLALGTAGAIVVLFIVCTYRQVGYWRSGITLFRHALAVTSPNNVLARYNLAGVLVNEREYDEAVEQYKQALRRAPGLADVHRGLGSVFAKQGRVDEAIAQYNQAVRLNPNDADTHNGLGLALAKRGRMDDAVKHYREALRINPQIAEGHYNLGFALALQGNFDEAVSEYREALKLKPGYAEAHNNLGLILAGLGNLDEAIEHFSAAVKIRPHDGALHNSLGLALASRGSIDEAVTRLLEVLRINPNDEMAHFKLGLVWASQEDYVKAAESYRKALKIKPDDGAAHRNLGKILMEQGKTDEAISHFSEALVLGPDDAQAGYYLAAALYSKGDYAGAWRQVHLCRRLGLDPPAEFIKALSRKMPEPRE